MAPNSACPQRLVGFTIQKLKPYPKKWIYSWPNLKLLVHYWGTNLGPFGFPLFSLSLKERLIRLSHCPTPPPPPLWNPNAHLKNSSYARYYLATSAARNRYPTSKEVTTWTMLILGLVFLFNIAFVGINAGLDVPYAFLVEGCYQDTREPRFKDDFLLQHIAYWSFFNLYWQFPMGPPALDDHYTTDRCRQC